MLDILSHGKYSLYAPKEMTEDNKDNFQRIFEDFRAAHISTLLYFLLLRPRPSDHTR